MRPICLLMKSHISVLGFTVWLKQSGPMQLSNQFLDNEAHIEHVNTIHQILNDKPKRDEGQITVVKRLRGCGEVVHERRIELGATGRNGWDMLRTLASWSDRGETLNT